MAKGFEECDGLTRNGLFQKFPLAFYESAEDERRRIERLKEEDPITLQDIVNTSRALVDLVKENDLEEVRRLVADAAEGEFLQVFVLQAFVHALKSASLEMVTAFVDWGVPLEKEDLSQSLHLVCEVTNRDNFSDAWRILQLLGDNCTALTINIPRTQDGWTPLCVACADACLPLCFKLLELQADPNAITRGNETPLALAKRRRDTDTEEQLQARDIIANMLQHYGGKERYKDALAQQFMPKPRKGLQGKVTSQPVSQTHTRFSA